MDFGFQVRAKLVGTRPAVMRVRSLDETPSTEDSVSTDLRRSNNLQNGVFCAQIRGVNSHET